MGPIISLAFLLALVLLSILFTLTVVNTLKSISFDNRKMQPDQAWFLVIPVINYLYIFIIAKKLAESIETELRSRNIPVQSKPTMQAGLAFAITSCLLLLPIIPFSIKFLLSLASLITWIIYWAKISRYKRIIQSALGRG